MTAAPLNNLKSQFNFNLRLRFILSRGALALLMGAFAVSASGCLAALAPLAMQALGMGVQAGTLMAHNGNKDAQETEAEDNSSFGDTAFDQDKNKNGTSQESKCNEMILVTPAIIQFRSVQTGAIEWRELGLGGSTDAPRWTLVAAADSPTANDAATGGWSPANNLNHMDFTPPLQAPAKPGDNTFMAYAPAASYTAAERDELASLVLDFGPVVGTFDYKGRQYKYSTLKELPCFPVPQ